ncbi:MAG: PBECR2 nuclease fold domain-containing protein [Peptococcaceae bacterium]|nr:PBECR2 nuclease fold domain-containing protein [Peptococcaceae bacterium]
MHDVLKGGIVGKTTEKVPQLHIIGNIDVDLFEKEFGILQTDEVILTNERDTHIKDHHPQDYSYFKRYAVETVQNPDIIIVDGKHKSTVFLVKSLPETNLNVVLRLAVETDKKELKNSIMTFHRVRNSYLHKMLTRNKVLYMRKEL